MRNLLIFIVIFSNVALAGKEEGLALMNEGKYEEALEEFRVLASAGDTTAMVTIGNMYYGNELGIDYNKAHKWWYQAYKAGNADALVNIGVLYRDGKGVKESLEVAYDIFVIVHMRGLGTESTQIRNGRNLDKTIARLDRERILNALCYSEEYILRYLDSKGQSAEATRSSEVKLKDKDWWLEGELSEFKC